MGPWRSYGYTLRKGSAALAMPNEQALHILRPSKCFPYRKEICFYKLMIRCSMRIIDAMGDHHYFADRAESDFRITNFLFYLNVPSYWTIAGHCFFYTSAPPCIRDQSLLWRRAKMNHIEVIKQLNFASFFAFHCAFSMHNLYR